MTNFGCHRNEGDWQSENQVYYKMTKVKVALQPIEGSPELAGGELPYLSKNCFVGQDRHPSYELFHSQTGGKWKITNDIS